MSVKVYALFGLVLVVAVIVGVMMTGSDSTEAPPSPHDGNFTGANPTSEAPSKENASASVKETIAHLRDVVAKDPKDAAALLELATLLQNSHNPQEAAGLYERGLKIDSTNAESRIDYSLCLFQIGRATEAMEQCRRVVSQQPGNIKALYNIGAIHANAGLKDSAEFYWSKVISLSPGDELASQAKSNIQRLHAALQSD